MRVARKRAQINDESTAIPKKKLKQRDKEAALVDVVPSPIPVFTINASSRLTSTFFDQRCLDLSRQLLGKYLCRRLPSGALLAAKVVECEAYVGSSDRASHTFNNKTTPRVAAMYMAPGMAYVYIIYGIHSCLNVSSQEAGAGVLIRALEPIIGIDEMRTARSYSKPNLRELTAGPSKLCQAMTITKPLFDQIDLACSSDLWFQDELAVSDGEMKTMSSKRIGIDNTGAEAVNQMYRFYVKGNRFVSVKPLQGDEEIVE